MNAIEILILLFIVLSFFFGIRKIFRMATGKDGCAQNGDCKNCSSCNINIKFKENTSPTDSDNDTP